MKRRYRAALLAGGLLLAAVVAPVAYVEGRCGRTGDVRPKAEARPLLAAAERRPEARTWLTYPEWHIVYSAGSFGSHLAAGKPPSDYPYGGDIAAFWRGACAVNRVTAGLPGASDAKVMIYTIGISFSAELAIKAAWERTIGRFAQWAGGHDSADDRFAARVQQRYAAFMHETPWYQFPFGDALAGLWRTNEPRRPLRHWERRIALSLEYGVKAGYARLIGWASGATLGRDEPTLRLVARASPGRLAAVDPRLRPVRTAPGGLTIVEAPRYAQFTDILRKLSAAGIELVEIAGNDEIFLTALVKGEASAPAAPTLFAMELGDRPGWRRVGLTTKVPALLPAMRSIERSGGRIEHVYDY
ncbi:MAG TPA: hypothetical protein VFS45_00095 [Sphingomicrobium sp.]|nr:hypothetical protein [Sphingomicrobium sp.]